MLPVGIYALSGVILVLVFFAISSVIGVISLLIYDGFEKRRLLKKYFAALKNSGFPDKLEHFSAVDQAEFFRNELQYSISNSEVINRVFEQILDYLLRDFVDNWYKFITDCSLFQKSLKLLAQRTASRLNFCLRRVDWISLLTHDLVDDFASHLKIFRKANERMHKNKSIHRSVDEKFYKNDDLHVESLFFDIELEMERIYCRDLVSTSPLYERAYLSDVSDIILFLIIPSSDFRSPPLRLLLRELLVNNVFLPLFDNISDPTFVDRMFVRLLRESSFNSNDFIVAIGTSNSVQELESVLEFIKNEQNCLNLKKRTSEDDTQIGQEIMALDNAEREIKRRMFFLANSSNGIGEKIAVDDQFYVQSVFDVNTTSVDNEIIQLPIMMILTHNKALAHFVEYLSQFEGQNYIDFFIAIEGFNSSVDNQYDAMSSAGCDSTEIIQKIQESALYLYSQYISKEIVQVLSTEERFYPGFKKHSLYLKMLEELGIEAVDESESCREPEDSQDLSVMEVDVKKSNNSEKYSSEPVDHSLTSVQIETLGIGRQGVQMFTLYNIRVSKLDSAGKSISSWNIIRRYSDFYALHNSITKNFCDLKTLSFPEKKAFKNFDQSFLEKRRKSLESYMNCLLQPIFINNNPVLEKLIFNFLTHKRYDGNIEAFPKRMVNAMFDPIIQSVRVVSSAAASIPDQMIDGIERVGSLTDQFLKASGIKNSKLSSNLSDVHRVAAFLEEKDSIPLRVLLLFLDEVFGLRNKNQWFRRRLVSLLRGFVNSVFGSTINKRIVNAVNWICSEQQVAQYLLAIRDVFWDESGNLRIQQSSNRRQEVLKTRFLARFLLLSIVPEELRLFIGDATTLSGIDNIIDALHNPHLNRRLLYVVFERFLITLFPNNHFDKIFPKLHSKSPRANSC